MASAVVLDHQNTENNFKSQYFIPKILMKSLNLSLSEIIIGSIDISKIAFKNSWTKNRFVNFYAAWATCFEASWKRRFLIKFL